jgi:tetratricopeptide (TPR) repeat protein
MGYQIFPNLIFLFSILGLIILILKRLPEAVNLEEKEKNRESTEEKLAKKGLPIITISFIKEKGKFWTKKIWQFALEAKDLRPGAFVGYRIRKLFKYTEVSQKQQIPINAKPITDEIPVKIQGEDEGDREKNILKAIKREPKNYHNYDELGKLYLETENYIDAKDIFLYLVNHESGHSEYQARLGFCLLKLKDYEQALERYKKSIALDSTYPNRYYNLGLCQELLQKYEEAEKSFGKALELEPENNKYLQAKERLLLKIKEQKK